MPPFGFLGGSLLTIALALWYNTSCAANDQEKSFKGSESIKNKLLVSIKLYFIFNNFSGVAGVWVQLLSGQEVRAHVILVLRECI